MAKKDCTTCKHYRIKETYPSSEDLLSIKEEEIYKYIGQIGFCTFYPPYECEIIDPDLECVRCGGHEEKNTSPFHQPK